LAPVASMEVQAPLGNGERRYWQWRQTAKVLAISEVLAEAEVMEIRAPNNDDVGAQCVQPVVLIDILAPTMVMEVWAMAVEMTEIWHFQLWRWQRRMTTGRKNYQNLNISVANLLMYNVPLFFISHRMNLG